MVQINHKVIILTLTMRGDSKKSGFAIDKTIKRPLANKDDIVRKH